MSTVPNAPVFGRRFLRHLSALVRIYWTSSDARTGAGLLAGTVLLEFGSVYGNFRLADGERRMIDAVQNGDATTFLFAVAFFAALSIAFVIVSAFRIYLRQLLEIRWRGGVTAHYLDRWMTGPGVRTGKLHGVDIDNPDQRIAEDIRDFTASALGLSLSLLAAIVTLASFGGLLWTLSGKWALPVGGHELRVPGGLFWVAMAYAAISTWLTHVVGRRLVPLNFDRLRYEADFRYGLVRFREDSAAEATAPTGVAEKRAAVDRFQNIVRNWWDVIAAQRWLTIVTGALRQVSGLVPVVVAAPGFFAGLITLGTVAQIRYAYGQVAGALSWFVYAYQEIARWRANVERLSTFAEVMDVAAPNSARRSSPE
jgi:putative ATP-binding cassette transporter